jgi:hypothetical protein
MTTEHLGTFQFLPPVPSGDKASLLIIGNEDGYFTLKSYIDDGTDVWYHEKGETIIDNEIVSEEFPNGFEAILVTL